MLDFEKRLVDNGMSETEILYNRVNTKKLLELIDKAAKICDCHRDYNNYGNFLFVTLALKGKDGKLEAITFYGAGLHEDREKYLTDQWFWYWSNDWLLDKPAMDKDEVKQTILSEIEKTKTEAKENPIQKRGKLFNLIADLADEDGAYTFLEDLDL